MNFEKFESLEFETKIMKINKPGNPLTKNIYIFRDDKKYRILKTAFLNQKNIVLIFDHTKNYYFLKIILFLFRKEYLPTKKEIIESVKCGGKSLKNTLFFLKTYFFKNSRNMYRFNTFMRRFLKEHPDFFNENK